MQHGLANALCLLPVMRFNLETSARKYAEIALSFGVNTYGMPVMEAAEKAIDAVEDLMERIAIPACLAEGGVEESDLPLLCEKAYEDSCHLTNPRTCTKEDLMRLYQQAYGKK